MDNLRLLKRGSTENKPSERQKNAKVRLAAADLATQMNARAFAFGRDIAARYRIPLISVVGNTIYLCYGQNNCSIFDVACSPECDRCDDRAVQCWLRAVAADPARYGTPDNIRYPCADCAVTGMTPEKQTRCRTAGCIP